MQIIKGFKVRIYPDKEQEKLLHYYCDISHKSWNNLVAYFKQKLEQDVNFKVVAGQFGIKDFEKSDLENLLDLENYPIKCPEKLFRTVLTQYSRAWKRCYKKINNSRQPKFHKFNPKKKSFGIVSRIYSIKNGKICLPKSKSVKKKDLGLSTIYIPLDNTYLDKLNISEVIEPRYTFHRGKWYLSGSYKKNIEVQKSEINIGLDWGIKDFYTDNNGNKYNYPLSVTRQFYRINVLKSKLSKKQENSNNWNKLSNKLDLAYERFGNLKRNFIEQVTAILSNLNIAVEELKNAKILKSSKNRRRLQMIAPRYEFIKRLEQKCNQKGNSFIKVNPAYTSLTCSNCGLVKEKLPLNVREFVCECGLRLDRDVNAAINIVARAFC